MYFISYLTIWKSKKNITPKMNSFLLMINFLTILVDYILSISTYLTFRKKLLA